MRRISKVKPKEISMCFEGANRRLIASYKSTRKPDMEQMAQAGTASDEKRPTEKVAISKFAPSKRTSIEDAISNCAPEILEKLTEIGKSVGGKDGQGYTPQAASIIKAVGRLIAPFSQELTLSDLAKIGAAAGLGATLGEDESDDETVEAYKSVAKGRNEDEDDEDEDYDGDDAAEDAGPEEAEDEDGAVDEDEDDETETDEEIDEDEDEADEDDVKKSSMSDFALAIKKRQAIAKAARDDSDKEEDEDEDDEGDNKPDKGAPPWLQGRKAKGAKMAKHALAGASAQDASGEMTEMRKQHQTAMEELRKTKAYLQQERAERQLENIKKSVRQDYAHLSIDDARLDVLAPMLKSMREAEDQSGFENFSSMLKSWDEQLAGAQKASNLFTAIGKSSANAASKAGSAEARIDARVDEEMKKSTGKVNRSVVYDNFIQSAEGRDLLVQQRREEGGL